MHSLQTMSKKEREAQEKAARDRAAKWRTNVAAADLLERAAALALENGNRSWPLAHTVALAAFDFEHIGGADSYHKTLTGLLKMDGGEASVALRALEARMHKPATTPTQPPLPVDQWRCDNCGHININADPRCVQCFEEANEQ